MLTCSLKFESLDIRFISTEILLCPATCILVPTHQPFSDAWTSGSGRTGRQHIPAPVQHLQCKSNLNQPPWPPHPVAPSAAALSTWKQLGYNCLLPALAWQTNSIRPDQVAGGQTPRTTWREWETTSQAKMCSCQQAHQLLPPPYS